MYAHFRHDDVFLQEHFYNFRKCIPEAGGPSLGLPR